MEFLRHPETWVVSVQLLILYCVSTGLFFAVDSANRSATEPLREGIKNGKIVHQLVPVGLAVVSNVLAVLTFVFISRKLNTVPRLAMIGLPLLLIVEKHVRAIRQDRAHRRYELLLAAGVTVGIIGGAIALMHGCPVK